MALLRDEDGSGSGGGARNVVTLDRPRGDAKPAATPAPATTPAASPATAPAPETPETEEGRAKPAAAAPVAAPPAPRKASRRKPVLAGLAVVLVAAGATYGHHWWTVGRFFVSTDDAYIQADVSTLGTKVSGYVAQVPVRDGDSVKAGQTLVVIDDTDYRLALQSAEAKRSTQDATIVRIDRQVGAQQAQIESAEASLTSAKAEAVRAEAAYQRAQSLAAQSFGSKAALDQAIADRDRANAAVANAEAGITSARATLDVVAAQKAEAVQQAKELDAAVDRAKSDVAATVIRAPADGVVGNRATQPGQYVAPGTRLMALVPMASVYVAANFKETQLAGIRPGQIVDIEVDSIPGHVFEGKVESLSPASGSTFSLLPPENATGNFTKITQRVPVRVALPADAIATGAFRPGLSVVASVDTRS